MHSASPWLEGEYVWIIDDMWEEGHEWPDFFFCLHQRIKHHISQCTVCFWCKMAIALILLGTFTFWEQIFKKFPMDIHLCVLNAKFYGWFDAAVCQKCITSIWHSLFKLILLCSFQSVHLTMLMHSHIATCFSSQKHKSSQHK